MGGIFGGGGGGAPAPTQQTITQSNIPDWLRPQVETTLGGAMQQLFQTAPGPDGTQTITGVKPYTPYGATTGTAGTFNPQTGQYQFGQGTGGAGAGQDAMQTAQAAVAGFSPLQQQAMQGVSSLGLPSTYGQAADITGQGIGGLFGLGAQSAGAGRQYARQAADLSGAPGTIGAYMNPYLQSALAPQIALQQQQQAIQQNQLASQASQAGAFGGSRFGLQQGLQNQANQLALQNLMGQGYNQAYQQAQQAQQFGANLGLQGLQQAGGLYGAGIQGAGQLAGIGGQALQAQQGILGLQAQTGAAQQAQQQQIINQAIQNYAQAQQYPLQQYNAFNALLRGYAVPGQSATTYQAPPSAISQLAGLGTAGLAGYKLANMKKGGKVKDNQGIVGIGLQKATLH